MLTDVFGGYLPQGESAHSLPAKGRVMAGGMLFTHSALPTRSLLVALSLLCTLTSEDREIGGLILYLDDSQRGLRGNVGV